MLSTSQGFVDQGAKLDCFRGAGSQGYLSVSDERQEVIRLLNDALATELKGVFRYLRHYFITKGENDDPAKIEWLSQAGEEMIHVDLIARRIIELGGEPDLYPDGIADSNFDSGEAATSMIAATLIEGRITILNFRRMLACLEDHDPITQQMIMAIIAVEEEHAAYLASLLSA